VNVFDGNGEWGIVDYIFEGYPWVPPTRHEDDNAVNSALATFFNAPLYSMPLYFTGGNVMTDGYGNIFSTRQMLTENEPIADTYQFFSTVLDYTGADNYQIVNNFESYGIQHIDCVAKLLNEETVLIKRVPTWHADYERIEEIAEQFSRFQNCFGRRYQIHRIDCGSEAAYTNSLILNKKVYVPLFGIALDENAIEVYENAMPGYEIVGIYYSSWYTYDALHCRTRAIFDRNMLHLTHRPLDAMISNQENIVIEVSITPHSNEPLIDESLQVFWRTENSDWQSIRLIHFADNVFRAEIPMQHAETTVYYYVQASDESGRWASLPRMAPQAHYEFTIFEHSEATEYSLSPTIHFSNYPNPFNPSTTIAFSNEPFEQNEQITIEIYNIKGQKIRQFNIHNSKLKNNKVVWNGDDESGKPVSSGIYFYKLKSTNYEMTNRMLLMK
jgi:hypothetical protein